MNSGDAWFERLSSGNTMRSGLNWLRIVSSGGDSDQQVTSFPVPDSFVAHLTMVSVSRMVRWPINVELEGNSCGPIKVLSWHLPGGTYRIHEKPPPGYGMSQPIFEPGTSRVWVKSATVIPTRSVSSFVTILTELSRLSDDSANEDTNVCPPSGVLEIGDLI
jgi:hypothetical protein